MKKESLLKQIMCALRAIVKKKTRALKARLIIHSLLAADRNFLVSSISDKLHHPSTPTTHQDQQHQLSHSLPTPHHHCSQPAPEEEAHGDGGVCEYGGDDDKHPDLSHSPFEAAEGGVEGEEGGSGGGGSVIEMVKHSKEEAGEVFRLEDDIDHVADLFIRNFHRQMRMQKQQSLKRYQEIAAFE